MVQPARNRVNPDEGVPEKEISSKSELEGLRMKNLGEGKAELGRSLEEEREGVEVRREGEVAHTGEEEDREVRRGGEEEGVNSDDVVEGEG